MNGFAQLWLYLILLVPVLLLIYWLWVLPFREKKTKEPERSAQATLLRRRVETGTNRSGRSSGMGYSYVLVFQTDDCPQLELYAYDTEYGALREGMKGTLTWKGPYYISFEEDTP